MYFIIIHIFKSEIHTCIALDNPTEKHSVLKCIDNERHIFFISDKFYLYILGSIMKRFILLLVVIGIACGKRVFTEPKLQITKSTIGSY